MIKFSEQEFGNIYKLFLRGNQQFEEAYEIAKRNSKGNVWIIGGYFYRNLAKKIYGESVQIPEHVDIDFLLEGQIRDVYEPEGWKLKMTDYGNIYFEKEDKRTDLNDLQNMHSIRIRKLRPTIIHFLTGVPYNVQSIIFDCNNQKVIGRKVGIDSINNKVLRVNNPEIAKTDAKNKGTTIEDLLKKKAEELGFKYIF
jgi:hypothetical protein